MGLFFQARSWRAPLQLIDCWLPTSGSTERMPATTRPSGMAGSAAQPASAAVQRFARAGWLGRKAANAPELDGPDGPATASGPSRPATSASSPARSGRSVVASATAGRVRARMQPQLRPAPRLVLSGRMDQVCAELDRLVAQEEALQRAA